jgi:mycothiol synthase
MGDVVIQSQHLDPAEVAEVLALTTAASDTDGAYPLSEHVMLHLRHGGDAPAVHLLVRLGEGGPLVGYAHLDPTDEVEGPSAELCVHPMYRRHGLGRALVLEAIAEAGRRDPTGRMRLWAHGDHPSAGALAVSLGFARARVLWQMRRSLYAPVPDSPLPAGIMLRAYRPGEDDAVFLRLNARAFADHPDQGRWGEADLQARLAESWFTPEGFLLAVRAADGVTVGFHWTKVHGSHRHETPDQPAHDHDPIGEVYVLGIDPDARGLGLGRALTLAGLRYLRGAGLDQVMLYVEETNRVAISLYSALGFARWSTDVCYRRL